MKEINSAFSDQIENIQQQLRKQGIPSVSLLHCASSSSTSYLPSLGHMKGDFPVSEDVADRCLSLPMSPYLPESDQGSVIKAITT